MQYYPSRSYPHAPAPGPHVAFNPRGSNPARVPYSQYHPQTPYMSNLPQPRALCQECQAAPRYVTHAGIEHQFCGKACAQAHAKRSAGGSVAPAPQQTALCRGCGAYPAGFSAGMPQTHCSKDCAKRWPITKNTCAFKGCHSQISAAFNGFCSAAHLNQKSTAAQNVLQKKQVHIISPPPPTPGFPAQPQSQSNLLSRHFWFKSAPPQNPSPILFYDQNAPHYGFTNFSPHVVKYNGKKYPTSEHLFQSFKFQDHRPDLAEMIRKGSDRPRDAFNLAQRFRQDVRHDWAHVSIHYMDVTLYHKFTQHSNLKAELLATGNAELVEKSDSDSFWGVGRDGTGRNELGKALMRLRTKLRGP